MNALIALALAATQQTASPNALSIAQAEDDWSAVTITLSFEAEAGDALSLNFADAWGPAENLTRLVSHVQVLGPDGPLAHTLDGAALTVPALPEGPSA
jgi:hypothetical protein